MIESNKNNIQDFNNEYNKLLNIIEKTKIYSDENSCLDNNDYENNNDNNLLELLLNLSNIKNKNLKHNLKLKLFNSLVPEWNIKNPDKTILNDNVIIIPKSNLYNFEKNILNGIKFTNKINDFNPDIPISEDFIKILNKLNNSGISFDMKFSNDYVIEIKPNEIVFPMCCVGKNRSQYLFYYLKNLQSIYPNNFLVGYPSSGDELSVLIDSLEPNKNILSSFAPIYKKDNFSKSILDSFGSIMINLNYDNLNQNQNQISRSIHVFDKILKNKDNYIETDIKNFENFKYKISKYDIFNNKSDNNDYMKIKDLFSKYFLTPDNMFQVINYNIPNKINKITYVCLSDKSFYNLCQIFYQMKNIELNNVRIIYFGIKDIFQKSNIKDDILLDYKNKFISSFQFVK